MKKKFYDDSYPDFLKWDDDVWIASDESHLAEPLPEPTPEEEAEANRLIEEFWRTFDIRDYTITDEEWDRRYEQVYDS